MATRHGPRWRLPVWTVAHAATGMAPFKADPATGGEVVFLFTNAELAERFAARLAESPHSAVEIGTPDVLRKWIGVLKTAGVTHAEFNPTTEPGTSGWTVRLDDLESELG